MGKSYRSKKHKKYSGGEMTEDGEDNSILNMDEPTTPSTPAPATSASKPAEEENKGWFQSLFGGYKTKRVRSKRMFRRKTRSNKHKSHKKRKRSYRK